MQATLLDNISTEEFTNDDYETPDQIACKIANLVIESDQYILEPFAGSGQIVKYLPQDRIIDCVELKTGRYAQGKLKYSHCQWSNQSFFDHYSGYDLIISNPPFSKVIEAISHALTLLNPNNSNSRILFLMPLDWNCAQSRAKVWNKLDAHIHHVYRIPKRVDYLINGVPCSQTPKKLASGKEMINPITRKPKMMSGRQCYDAVFDIRLGKENPSTTFLY